MADLGSAVASVRDRCTFPVAGTTVTCAVSGGADSLALLALAVDAGLRVTAVHVDHGLRPDSAGEARVVADAADRFGAGFRAERVTVDPGGDLEARARRARHHVLPDDALFGHTLDDQAETVILALLRGTGLDGLRGMSPARHPILAVRRAETEAICAALSLDPVRDPTNTDARFRRNRIRHEVLPLLDDVAERDVRPILARSADVVAADVEHLERLAAAIDPTDARALADAPVALGRRAVRAWLRAHDPDGHPPDLASVDRVLGVARGDAVAAQVGGGLEIRRSNQQLEARRLPVRG
ncbi:tRNA lysidine(34) synthetase TilS [Actinospongicola halichondriae]|uniref:tRNA lysidine(34) synthetase TilS n=1 Tax=Actinospongicola halichondriae TaxID=3236844 RepID=UPI003D4E01F9